MQLFDDGFINARPLGLGLGNHTRGLIYDAASGYLIGVYKSSSGDYRAIREKDGVVESWAIQSSRDPSDGHYHISNSLDPDGRIRIWYDGHYTPGYTRLSVNPLDPSSWGAESQFVDSTTYSQPFYVGENAFVVHRWGGNLGVNYTLDGGQTFQNQLLFDPPGSTVAYPQELSVINSRVHLVATRLISGQANSRIKYIYTEDGLNWFDWQGNPNDPNNTLWVDTDNNETCPRGVAVASDGHVVIAEFYSTDPNDTLYGAVILRLRKFNGGAWDIVQQWPGYYSQLNGPLIIVGDQWRVYASRFTGAYSALDELASNDGGQTWVSTEIAQCSLSDRIVSQRVRGDNSRIAWVCGAVCNLHNTGIGSSPPPPPPPPQWQISNSDAPWGDGNYRIRDGIVEELK